jgi:RNA polymerase sigma-70 factor (ECF subfamily)
VPNPRNDSFAAFLERLRSGDERAAEELVRQFEPVIRREVRMHLHDPGLYRVLDSMDVCQSVMASFFVRAAAGQYDLNQPKDLLALLVRMARNKVASQARKARCRPAAGIADDLLLGEVAGPGAGPAQVAAGRDLLRQVLKRLPAAERRLAELRAQGRTWPEISTEVGTSPEACRKQLSRALDDVVRDLGLEEDI